MEQFYRADQLGVRIYQFIAEAGENLVTLPFPIDGKCPNCGTFDEFHLVEFGYTRCTAVGLDTDIIVEAEEPALIVSGVTATTDGWDDMSDDGALTILVCRHCDSIIAMPTDVEIDYC